MVQIIGNNFTAAHGAQLLCQQWGSKLVGDSGGSTVVSARRGAGSATTTIPVGKVEVCHRKRQKIPFGWGLNSRVCGNVVYVMFGIDWIDLVST